MLEELKTLLGRGYEVINDLNHAADVSSKQEILTRNGLLAQEKANRLTKNLHEMIDSFDVMLKKCIAGVVKDRTEVLASHSNEIIENVEYISDLCMNAEKLLQQNQKPSSMLEVKTQFLQILKECEDLKYVDYDTFTSVDLEVHLEDLFKPPIVNIICKDAKHQEKHILHSLALCDLLSQFGDSLSDGKNSEQKSVPATPVPGTDKKVCNKPTANDTTDINHNSKTMQTNSTEGNGSLQQSRQKIQENQSNKIAPGSFNKGKYQPPHSKDIYVRPCYMDQPDSNVRTNVQPDKDVHSRSEKSQKPSRADCPNWRENRVSVDDSPIRKPSESTASRLKSRTDENWRGKPIEKSGQNLTSSAVQKKASSNEYTHNSTGNKNVDDNVMSVWDIPLPPSPGDRNQQTNATLKNNDPNQINNSAKCSQKDSTKVENCQWESSLLPPPMIPVKVEQRARTTKIPTITPVIAPTSLANRNVEADSAFSNTTEASNLDEWDMESPEQHMTVVSSTVQSKKCPCDVPLMKFSLRNLFTANSREIKGTLVKTYPEKGSEPLTFPTGVTVRSDGVVVVADTGSNHVTFIEANASFKPSPFTWSVGIENGIKFKRPSAVVCDSDDNVYVKDDFGVQVFDVEGKKMYGFGNFIRPYGLALAKDSSKVNAVVIDENRRNSKVYVCDINDKGKSMSFPYEPLVINGTAESKVRFFAVHKNSMLTSDLGSSMMYLSTFNGKLVRGFGRYGTGPGEFREPSGVTVDADGNWLVGDSKNNRIQVFTPDGYYLSMLTLDSPLRRPSGIHLTSDGHLYVINYIDAVIKVFKLHG